MISDNLRGAGLMMLGMAGFTLNDTFLKALAGTGMPLFQTLFLRGVIATLALTVMAASLGALRFRFQRTDWTWLAVRVLGEVSAAYFFLTALFNMPLANATAILQATPLAVTLAAALFFGAPVGWRRMVTIVVGFIGILLIVRPGTAGFNQFSLYALAAVACVTLRDLSTRQLGGAVPSLTVTVLSAAGVTLFFGVGQIVEVWQPVSGHQWGLLLASTFFIIIGYSFSVLVMRVGDVSFVAPFRYTGLIWAIVLGWAVFGDWPTTLTLIGSGVVVGSGIYMLYREAQLARRAARINLAKGVIR